jgi:hypothetical protein
MNTSIRLKYKNKLKKQNKNDKNDKNDKVKQNYI